MPETTQPTTTDTASDQFDAIVVGAGISGLHQLWELKRKGLSVRVLEAGSGIGGVWFWNRYPGARFDSESYSYGYFFSQEIIDEWNWSEEYASQTETEQYLNFVADRLGLRDDISFNTKVASTRWSEDERLWIVTTVDGATLRASYLITALGILSKPAFPKVPGAGLEAFTGEWHHTGLWPADKVEFAGKRIAVIGTGSSGVQIVPFAAAEAASLTVFQRSPNWCTPINNFTITPERMVDIRGRMDSIHELTMSTPGGGIHQPRQDSSLAMTDEQRRAVWDELYEAPGMAFVMGNFRDIAVDRSANANVTAYLAEKIRARVNDPAVAAQLIPTDHGFGQKRPPLENGYFETFNQPHVTLVSTVDEPIVSYTPTGLETNAGQYEFDLIIIATGFEAVVGSYRDIDIRGVANESLNEHWEHGPRSYLGLQVAGFPNLFMVGGPQSSSGIIPRLTESQAIWVAECIAHLRDHDLNRIETSPGAEDEWAEHVNAGIVGTLQEDAESWAFGSNVDGRPRAYLLYAGGQPQYREKIAEAAEAGYKGFELS